MKSSLQSCLKFQWRTTRCTFRPRASLSDSRRPPRLQLRPSPLILWMNGQGSPRQRLKPHWEKCCCGFLANRGWRKSCWSWTEEKRSQSRRSAACCFGSHCYHRCFRWFRAEPRLPCWTVDAWVLGWWFRHRPLLLQGTRSSPGCWSWPRQTSRPSVEFRPSLAHRFRPRPQWLRHTRWARSAAWERTGTQDLTHSPQRHHFRRAAEGTAVGMRMWSRARTLWRW